MNDRIGRIYFGVLGIVTLIFGITDLIVTMGGNDFSWGILEISSDMFRGGWGGIIVISAGFFYLSSLKNFLEIHQLSRALMASILIWILAGTDIFVRITESIPGGEEGPWFNSLEIIIYSNKLKNYDFGEGHPFRSDRFEKFLELFREKLGKDERFKLIENITLATDGELKLWHSKDYIKAMKDASRGKIVSNLFRFISGDNVNPSTKKLPQGIEEGARAIVKNSLLAIDYIQQSKTEKAVSIGGGLHHATSGYGQGFCVYNDVVIAAKYAIEKYNLKRVLILDTDAHAGNGTSRNKQRTL